MERNALARLKEWKDSINRKPLIIKGARQVGKTWLMKEFGKRYFKNTVYVNFDNNERLKAVFDGDYNIARIIQAIELEADAKINSDNTLIIFDEIQEVPRALASLKYFCENAPQYAIVAAGSLLGVALHEGTSFPVGKVNTIDLYPMNYKEFLCAVGDDRYMKLLETGDFEAIKSFKSIFINRLKEYYFVGGMPEVVKCFVDTGDFGKVREIQKDLLSFYQQDFSKHASTVLVPRLNMIWNSIPMQLAKENKKFIYGQIREGARAKDFELAIQWLIDCGLIHKVYRINKPELPLRFYMDMSAFKLYLLDIGLIIAMADLKPQIIIDGNRLFTEFKGALTEQYVLQQLVSDVEIEPFYYSTQNSTGEIDFLLQGTESVVPVEVKAEENLKARSLRAFCNKYKPDKAVRTSMSDYREQEWLVNIPLYNISFIKNML